MFVLRALFILAISIPTVHAQQGLSQLTIRPVKFVHPVDGRIVEETVPRSRLAELAPHFVFFSGKFYDSVATYNRLIVEGCVSSSREGESVKVDHPFQQLCRSSPEGDLFARGQIKLAMARSATGVRVDLRVRLRIDPEVRDRKRASELLSKTRACVPAIQELWQRYLISLNVQLDSDRQPTLRDWDQDPILSDRTGRSNTGQFFFQGFTSASEADRQGAYCLMVAHEVGHYLGLPDEYSDPDCSDRQGVFEKDLHLSWWPFDLMSDQGKGFGQVEVYPWDIQRLLEPLCAAPLP